MPFWSALILMSTVLGCEKRYNPRWHSFLLCLVVKNNAARKRFTWSSHSVLSCVPTRNVSMIRLTNHTEWRIEVYSLLGHWAACLVRAYTPSLPHLGAVKLHWNWFSRGVCMMCRSTLRRSRLQCLLVQNDAERKRASEASIQLPVVLCFHSNSWKQKAEKNIGDHFG